MGIEQRIGRVDRIGQKLPVKAFNLIFDDSVALRVPIGINLISWWPLPIYYLSARTKSQGRLTGCCRICTVGSASHLLESRRSLKSLHHPVHGTASKRALLIGCPQSPQMPNSLCRIRVKASSMARVSLLSVWCNRICETASISPADLSTGSPRCSPAVRIESTILLPLVSSRCFVSRSF
jgi:hypothetical protein